MIKRKIGVIGGDLRQVYLCNYLLEDGHDVYSFGLENSNIKSGEKKVKKLEEITDRCNNIILGIPATRDGKILNAPYSEHKILLNNSFMEKLRNKNVFLGIAKKFANKNYRQISIKDYSFSERFVNENAVLTVQGAIATALNLYKYSIKNCKSLIAGFGRIGKLLAKDLSALGADVIASARKTTDLNMIHHSGYKAVETSKISQIKDVDLIFSTIPFLIFDETLLRKINNKNLIIIDLASGKGSVDYDSAKKLGINAIHALSLPSKFTPKAAAETVKNEIYSLMEGG